MNARRHETAVDEGNPEAHVTNRTCLSRRWCGWLKWGVMLSVLGGVCVAAGWMLVFDLGTRGMAYDLTGRLQVEETKSDYVEKTMIKIEKRLDDIDAKLAVIKEQQAAFFGKSK